MQINKDISTELDPYGKAALNKTAHDRAAQQSQDASGAGKSFDTVKVSDEGKLRTDVYRQAMSAPDVRQERVDRLKNEVASGTYQINSRDIADKLLREDAAIFGSLEQD